MNDETLPAGQEDDVRRQLRDKGLAPEQRDRVLADLSEQREPCAPCGEKGPPGPGTYFANKPPYYLLLGECLHRTECEQIIEIARAEGWEKGTIIDGSPSRNSSVRFLRVPWIVDRVRKLAATAGPMLGLDVWPELLESVQIGRYLPPSEDYGWHVDHDPSRRHVPHDRKLSLVGALSDGGCLEVKDVGRLNLNAGDFLAFGANVSHMAPPLDYKRYTIVAWIPGPPWR